MNTDITVNLEQWDRLVSEHRALREALEQAVENLLWAKTKLNMPNHTTYDEDLQAACDALAAVKGDTK
jgi:hypothetical protein